MSDNAAVDPQQYLLDRRKFALKVLILFIVVVALSLLQWVPLLLLSEAGIFIKQHFYVSIVWLMFALIALTIFAFIEKARHAFPINWIIFIIIFEGVILGLARVIVISDINTFMLAFFGVLLYVIIFLIIGCMLEHDLTLNVILMFILAIMVFFSALLYVILFILSSLPYANYVFAAFVFITVTVFVMFHAQMIYGDRNYQMRINEFLIAALVLYHDFVILFIVVFYLTSKTAIFKADDRMIWYLQGAGGDKADAIHVAPCATTISKPIDNI